MKFGRSGTGTAIIHAPAVRALLIQALAFLLVLLLECGMQTVSGYGLSIAAAALTQGAIAALMSYWRRLAAWWLPIHFVFPLALLAVHALHLPPWIFLAAFAGLTGLYWTSFRTQVPFFPSGSLAWNAVAEALPQKNPVEFIDIGSGLGGLLIHLAALRPASRFTGIEIAPLPWLISFLRARAARSRAHFIRGDYGYLDFAGFDVVFAYLSPAAMPALWEKARAEMRPGTLLLSYEFPIVGVKPDLVVPGPAGYPVLFGWRIGV